MDWEGKQEIANYRLISAIRNSFFLRISNKMHSEYTNGKFLVTSKAKKLLDGEISSALLNGFSY